MVLGKLGPKLFHSRQCAGFITIKTAANGGLIGHWHGQCMFVETGITHEEDLILDNIPNILLIKMHYDKSVLIFTHSNARVNEPINKGGQLLVFSIWIGQWRCHGLSTVSLPSQAQDISYFHIEHTICVAMKRNACCGEKLDKPAASPSWP